MVQFITQFNNSAVHAIILLHTLKLTCKISQYTLSIRKVKVPSHLQTMIYTYGIHDHSDCGMFAL